MRRMMVLVIVLFAFVIQAFGACPQIDPNGNGRTDLNDQVKILQILTKNTLGVLDPQAVFTDINQDGNLGMAENMLVSQIANETAKCNQPVIFKVPSQYPTIGAAIAAIQPGGVVEVAAGNYSENVIIDKPLTLRGESMVQTTLDVSNIVAENPCQHPAIRIESNDVVVRDFTVTGGCPGIEVIGENVFIIGNRIWKNVSASDCGGFGLSEGVGIFVTGDDCTIQNNIIIQNGFQSITYPVANEGGVGLGIASEHAMALSILNNVISANTGFCGPRAAGNGYGMHIFGGQDSTIANNIVTDNDYIGSGPHCDEYNGIGIDVNSGSNFDINYNNVWNNDLDNSGSPMDYSLNGVNIVLGPDNISTDPQFVDEVWYHLSPTSPSIDAGDPNYAYALEPVPNGGRINQGAYGNTAQATTSPP